MPPSHEYLPQSRDMKRVASDAAKLLITYHLALIIFLLGCGSKEQIHRYTVEKQEKLEKLHNVKPQARLPAKPEVGGPAQTLAAMIPLEERGWFFKITGSPELVGPHAADFNKFVASIRFSSPTGNPTWKLPAGWTESPGSSMRFATIQLGNDEKPLDMSVIMLPRNEEDESAYVLANLNRWRNQLQLPPIEAKQLTDETKRVDLDGAHAIVVDLKGESAGDGMGAAPFAGGMNRRPPMADAPAAAPQPASLKYQAPAEWKTQPAGGMRKAAFSVEEGDHKAEMTVIDLAAGAGALLPNVNRWRDQMQLSPTTQADLDREVKKISVDSVEGQYVELSSPKDVKPPKSMLGVVAIHGDKAWFFKFTGDSTLVKREK